MTFHDNAYRGSPTASVPKVKRKGEDTLSKSRQEFKIPPTEGSYLSC